MPSNSSLSWPLALNDAGQVVISSYLYDPTSPYNSFRVFRSGSDGLRELGSMRDDSHRGAFYINKWGQVAGLTASGTNFYDTHAIFFDGQTVNDLGTLGGTQSFSTGLNDAGQIVGMSTTDTSSNQHGFVSNGTGMQQLDVPGVSSTATGINNNGHIVGTRNFSANPTYTEQRAYVIRNGVLTDLGTLSGTESWATTINDAGHIIGGIRYPNFSSRAFRYHNGVMTDLGTLGGTSSEATDVNAAGVVIGQAQATSVWGQPYHAFMYGNDGVMRDLGTVSDSSFNSMAIDINDNGQIVGWSDSWSGGRVGFVYQNSQMYNLNSVVNGELGWTITEANFINSRGQIAAMGYDRNGQTRALLLTPNSRPVGNLDTPTVEQDSVGNLLRVLENDTDADGDELSLQSYAGAVNGTIEVTSDLKALSYTPSPGFVGTDYFWYSITDGSSTLWMFDSITVVAKSQGPIAYSQSLEIDEDTTRSIVLTAQAEAGQSIGSYIIQTQPQHGTLSGTAPNLTYTPATNYNGSDSFTFKANDGSRDTNIATVDITVRPVNDVPAANAQTLTTNEDTALPVSLTGSDADNDPLSFIVQQPAHGTLSGTAPNLIYTPNANYNGPDSFEFKTNDGTYDSALATISITVEPVNDAPVANDDTATVDEDTWVGIEVLLNDTDAERLEPDYTGFTIVSTTTPANGTLEKFDTNVIYRPNRNYHGTDTFSYTIRDAAGATDTAQVVVTVTPVNDLPEAEYYELSTTEDTPKTVALPASDIDGDAMTAAAVEAPLHGTLSINGINVTYTPHANYFGGDEFLYKVNDGTGDSNISLVRIMVNAANDVPVAEAQTVAVAEDTAKGIMLTGTDIDGDFLNYTLVSQPTKGTLSGVAPDLVYTPNANYNGADSFTFKVNDGTADSNTATVSINVTAVNDAPVANTQTVTTNEDTAKAITLSASDIDGDALTYSVVAQPTKGTLSGSGANLTYTPNANFNGSDSFTFKANDGTVNSAVATVNITVAPVNDAPVASAQTVTTNEDTAKSIVLAATDVDGNALTYSVVTQPTKGTLSGSGANLTYTPNANYNGSDSFTFKANDGTADSNTATISITVAAVNDAPVANAQTVTSNEDTTKNITLAATDVDGDVLSYTVVAQPTKGTLSGSGANLTYTPNANSNGTDSFTFKANDGTVDSNIATVSITVTPVNDAPVSQNKSVTTLEDTPKNITLAATDIDGDTLTYSLLAGPDHGTLSGTAPNVTYTPSPNYNGPDSFSFKANDGTTDSNTAIISITVDAVNNAPVANAQAVTTNEDTAKNITFSATDVDGDALTYSIVTGPSKGTLSGTGANRVYTPNANATGADSFTFKANDGTVDSNTATVSMTINAVNDAPVANAQSVTTNEDTTKNIALAATDVEGDALTYSIVAQPSKGTLSGSGANRVYTPNANFNGSDSFTFKANDGTADSNVATVNITIAAVNDAPTAVAQTITTNEDTAKAITLAGTDIDGDTLTYTVVTAPTRGTLSGTGANRVYTPNTNFNGSDSFSFKVNDGQVDSSPATVSITVSPVNDAPVAVNDTASTPKNASKIIAVLANDSDVDGDTLAIASVQSAVNGTVAISGTSVNFTPARNFIGNASFSYTIRDGKGGTATATVAVTVTK